MTNQKSNTSIIFRGQSECNSRGRSRLEHAQARRDSTADSCDLAATAQQYLQEGDAVGITVRVQGSEYADKANGRVRHGVTLTGDLLHLIPNGRAPKRSERNWARPAARPIALNKDGDSADLPF